MWKTDSFEKTLMLGKIDGGRRRGRQRMRWLDSITNSMGMSLSNSRSWWWTGRPSMLQSMGLQRVRHDWVTELNWTLITGLTAVSPFDFPFSPPDHLYLLPPSSLLYLTLWISLGVRAVENLRELITGWIGLSPFDSPSSPLGHLYLPPPSSLLHVTLWTSLGVHHCGETFHL